MKRRLLLLSVIVVELAYLVCHFNGGLNAQAPTNDSGPQPDATVLPEFVPLKPGTFTMGCDEEQGKMEGNECYDPWVPGLRPESTPRHTVTLTKKFEIGKYEVTQQEWQSVMNTNPSHFRDSPKLPVENVTRADVLKFLDKLNAKKDGYHYRLPTEAEWEYAARAGVETPIVETGSFRFLERDANGVLVPGRSDWRKFPLLSGTLDLKGWYSNNSGGRTHEVGQLEPNRWGISDMLGNVAEMVEDTYSVRYYETSPVVDPENSVERATTVVVRGGSWNDSSVMASVWYREPVDLKHPGLSQPWIGFRAVRDHDVPKSSDQ